MSEGPSDCGSVFEVQVRIVVFEDSVGVFW